MKVIKKSQIIAYVIALMLVTAGYLNYSTENKIVETTTSQMNEEIAQIGDATLVSSQDVTYENQVIENTITENQTINNEQANNLEEKTNEVFSNSEEDYFTSSKLERTNMYSQMLETYEKILENTSISETQKSVANEEITKINNIQNSIMICENLIKTKGFNNVIIFVNGDSVSAIVQKEKLEADEIAQIQNLVSRELNSQIENIHITSK